jgi:predicted membrane-bound mannosyltransferase
MSFSRAVQIWKITGLLLAGIYVLAALIGLIADFESTQDTVVWVAVLGGGAVLILVGQYFFRSSPWVSALLVSVGAAVGALVLFWSILIPLAAAAVIALSVALARQTRSATA